MQDKVGSGLVSPQYSQVQPYKTKDSTQKDTCNYGQEGVVETERDGQTQRVDLVGSSHAKTTRKRPQR